MTKSRKLQIPISVEDEKTIKAIAKIYKVPAAEWVRNTIIRAAQRDLFNLDQSTPKSVLEKLSKANAPTGSVKSMKEESIKGRFK